MKAKIIFILMILAIVIAVILFKLFDKGEFYNRYHQHKEVSTSTFTKLNFSNIETHLPVININTNNQKVPGTPIKIDENNYTYELTDNGESEIVSSITLYEKEKSPLELTALIHYRGHSSRYFNKKNYDIGFVDSNKNKVEVSLLGMEADNNWVLHGPYIDRTLIRNYVAMNLTGEIMPFAPDVRFVELFVNNRYDGLYVLMEKVSKGEGRVPITTPEQNSNQTGYIVEIDRAKKTTNPLKDFITDTFKVYPSAVDIIYPSEKQFTEERKNFIDKDFSSIAHSISQMPVIQDVDYQKLINVQAFYDYFIINELFRNSDAGLYSTYFYRDLRGKLTPVVWDFNNSLDNYQNTPFDESEFSLIHSVFYQDLLTDENFVNGLINRYRYLRETALSTKRIHRYIDETVKFLGPSIERNNNRWKEMYDLTQYNRENYLTPVERNVENYPEAIEQMKDYLEKRGEWLDENIEVLHQYSHPSRIGHEAIR